MKTRLIYLLLIFFSLQFTLLAQTDRKITLDFQNEELPAALKKLEQASGYRILFTYDDIQKYTVNLSRTKLSLKLSTFYYKINH